MAGGFKETYQFQAESSRINAGNISDLDFSQRILCFGGLVGKYDAVTDYTKGPRGTRYNSNFVNPEHYSLVVEKFKIDPKQFLGVCRQNLMRIKFDQKLSPNDRLNRFNRYLDSYLELTLKLDHAAFPPSSKTYYGVPAYVPDGLSDWGMDDTSDPALRMREKIRVNKKKIFYQMRPLLQRLLSLDQELYSNGKMKEIMINEISTYIHLLVTYDQFGNAHRNEAQSMPLSDAVEKRLGVCRHHALYAQTLLQVLGISSRLLKSEFIKDDRNLGPHANNLVRVNGLWHLLDITNPEHLKDPDRIDHTNVFLRPIPERIIDLNQHHYNWEFTLANGRKRGYRSRNNMFFQIKDNEKKPV